MAAARSEGSPMTDDLRQLGEFIARSMRGIAMTLSALMILAVAITLFAAAFGIETDAVNILKETR
jgi:hypothetical protein